MFESGEDITHETAKAVLKQGLTHIAQGASRLDCRALARFDSSALAVILAWRRATLQKGSDLRIEHAPAALQSLARAYGVDTVVFGHTL